MNLIERIAKYRTIKHASKVLDISETRLGNLKKNRVKYGKDLKKITAYAERLEREGIIRKTPDRPINSELNETLKYWLSQPLLSRGLD